MDKYTIEISLRDAIIGNEIIRDMCRKSEYEQTSSNSYNFKNIDAFISVVESFQDAAIEITSEIYLD